MHKPAPVLPFRRNRPLSVMRSQIVRAGATVMLLCMSIHRSALADVEISGADSSNGTATSRLVPAEWTIMVFMNGNNNLEADALRNFAQMALVPASERINIVVEFARMGKYAITRPQWSRTLRFRVTPGMKAIPANAVEDLGDADMGDTATIHKFVLWAKSKYPARRTALIVWGHGQGYRLMLQMQAISVAQARSSRLTAAEAPRRGDSTASPATIVRLSDPPTQSPVRVVSSDDKHGTKLYNRGIQLALANEHLNIIGFDACLMSMLETAYAMRSVAALMVASEELEPGYGWNYTDILTRLAAKPTMDPAELSTTIVESYRSEYGSQPPQYPTTLAAVDLTRASQLVSSVSALADVMLRQLALDNRAVVAARSACSEYAPNPFGDGQDYFHHIDVGCFADALAGQGGPYSAEVSAVQSALRQAVIANYASSDRQGTFGSHGLAIYFPKSRSDYDSDPYQEGGYEKANTIWPVEFVRDPAIHWADFLHKYLQGQP